MADSQVSGLVEQVKISNTTHNLASTAYGICDTAANTAAKTVNMTGFYLTKGVTVHIKFTNANTAESPTLNINNTGAKALSISTWTANSIISLTYDNSQWVSNNDIYIKKIDSSSDNAIVRFDGAAGEVQNSLALVDDNGFIKSPGLYVHKTTSVNQSGYIKFLTLTVTNTYVDRGIKIDYSTRAGRVGSIYGNFANVNSTDPNLTLYKTGNANIYYIKSNTSTWDLYINKSENYADCVFSITNPGEFINNKITLAWVSEHVTALPENYLTAEVYNKKVNITGNVYIDDKGSSNGIYYKGTNTTTQMINFLDNTTNNNGNGIKIGGGGVTVISAGESKSINVTADAEDLYLLADNVIYLESNAQTLTNRIGIKVSLDGHIIPTKTETNNDNQQNLGASNARWANVYATTFNGALSGNASSATQIYATKTTPAASTSYYLLDSSTSTSGNTNARFHENLYYYYGTGTTGYLNIGSGSDSGAITLHNANGKYVNIITSAFTDNRILTLPDISATIFTVNSGNSLSQGNSDVTASTEILTSYASNNGFSDSNAVGTVYRRAASKVVNATLVKAALGTVSTTAHKFLKDTGSWAQVSIGELTGTASANTVFAGPSSGSDTTPSFRSLVTADIPSTLIATSISAADSMTISTTAADKTITINSKSTLFLGNSASASVVFKINSTEVARFNTDGNLAMADEKSLIFKETRKKDSGGGWAFTPIKILDNSNTEFAHIGVHGTNNTMLFMYIGASGYNGSNLRIFPNGTIGIASSSVVYNSSNTINLYFNRAASIETADKMGLIFINYTTVNNKNCADRFYFRHYAYDSSGNSLERWEQYRLPAMSANLASTVTYDILTTKDLSFSITGNAATSSYPLGFSSRTESFSWGDSTGTAITAWNDASGGSIGFRKDNPSSGKLSVVVDGRYYFNEGNTPVAGLKSANGYWGMTDPDGADNVFIRTTSQGIIPYQGGGATAGHGYLGTSSWYFRYAYIQDIYGNLTGNVTGNATTADKATALGSPYTSSTRPTNANITHVTDGGIIRFCMGGNNTTNGPGQSGNVLHFHWDTSSAWDCQLHIPDSSDYSMHYRGHTNVSTWGSWKTILDSSNYSSYRDYPYYLFVRHGSWVKGTQISGDAGCSIQFVEKGSGTDTKNRLGMLYSYACGGTLNTRIGLWAYKNVADSTDADYFLLEYGWNGTTAVKRTRTDAQIYGAVWNDYAEFRKTNENAKPGQVVIDNDDGSLNITYARLLPGAQVVSDTFGFAIGETEKTKTPLAVSGRVLVYTYQDRNKYHAGQAVCSAPNGTVDIMTRREIETYPDAIVGIVSEIPDYEEWGQDNVKVNGRIWIKVK